MRSTLLSLGSGLALAGFVAGCTEETPPPVVPTTPVASVAVAAPAPTPPVDLSPVPDPSDVIFVARWKSPNATLTGFGTCAGLPQTLVDARAKDLLDGALAHAFRGGVDGRQIADAISLDASVDMVATLDAGRRGQPDVLFAFSVGLTSLERARGTLEAAGPLVELQPGFWRVGPQEPGEITCVIGPSAGAAPARLVCGKGDKDVSALAPFLTHNVPAAPPPAHDIQAELRFVPIEARYGEDLRRLLGMAPNYAKLRWATHEPRFDDALEAGASALADEGKALVSDLDRISVDVGMEGGSCLTASGALQLRGKSSWLAGLLSERSEKQGPPPAIFWRAPVDSDSASYSHAADAARYGGIVRTLRGLVEGYLARARVGSDADRKALGALLDLRVGKDTNVVFASGHSAPGKHAVVAGGGRPNEEQIVEELAQSYMGWAMLGFDEGPAAPSKMLKDLVAVYGRKGLMDPVRKWLGADGEHLPTVKLVPAPSQLGRGALDVDIHFDLPHRSDPDGKKKKEKAGGVDVHMLLMGEAKSTWIAFGASREELVKRLLAAKGGAPDAGTLASRPGLESLRSGKALSSGFVTLGLLTHRIGNVLTGPLLPPSLGPGSPLGEIVNTLVNLPHKGDTPIFLSSTTTAQGPRAEATFNMPKGSFEDVGAILMTINHIATSQGLLRP